MAEAPELPHAERERRLEPSDRRRVRRGGGRRITDLATHDEAHVTLPRVAEYFNVDRSTVLKWVDAELLPGFKFGKEWRFKTADLEAFSERHKVHRDSGQ